MTNNEQLILKMYVADKRKKAIIIVSVLVFLVLIGLIVGIVSISSHSFELKNETVTVEYGTAYTPSIDDFVNVNDDVTQDNTMLEWNIKNEEGKEYASVGEYDVNITHTIIYSIKGKELFQRQVEKTAKVIVKDTTPPTFSDDCPTTLSIMQNTADTDVAYIVKYFTASDLSGFCDININFTELNVKMAGNYVIEVVAKDKYNNKTTMECKIVVTAPSLILKQDDISIVLGNTSKIEVDYDGNETPQYVSSNKTIASVDENGNVKALHTGKCYIKVFCNGLYAICNVEVKEKPTTQPSATQKPTTNSNTTQTKNNDSGKNYPNKDFLFTDGYTMENVSDAAYSYLKASGKAGSCIPLKNDEGIYIGMRVVFE